MEDTVRLTRRLKAKLGEKLTESEREFYLLGEQCRSVASGLLGVLGKPKVPARHKWENLQRDVLNIWKGKEISSPQGILDNLKRIVFSIVVTLR